MNKKLFIGAIIGLLALPISAKADGVSTIRFEGNNNVNTGDEFTVNMVIDNIDGTNGGIVAFGGYINYDKNVLELISTENGDAYEVNINQGINKIAAIDYSLTNGITERTNVYRLTFRAINEGNTSITLTDGEVVDTNSNVSFTVEGLSVNSNNIVIETETHNEEVVINEEKQVINEPEVVNNNEVKVVNKKAKKAVKTTKKAKNKANKNIFSNLISFINNIFKK